MALRRPAIYLIALLTLLIAFYVAGAQSTPPPDATPSPSAPLSAPAAAPETHNEETIWQVIVKGGWTMVPLALISTLIAGFSLERYFFFRRRKLDASFYHEKVQDALRKDGIKGVEQLIAADDRLIARILRSGLSYSERGAARMERELSGVAQVEIGNLERGLNLLANLGNLAPLLGFLGTVVGMRHSFLQFVLQAAPTAQDLAGGVEEALITTVAGLMIAIPTYLIYNLFIFKIDTFTNEVERCSQLVLARVE
ncbi:MAG: MotA/TolQ/ExbB proton channel family protein [Leptospirales bacterium]|nr:MotA/TolQ/ExbB proton channel family protein [Leptospirales bacterium]